MPGSPTGALEKPRRPTPRVGVSCVNLTGDHHEKAQATEAEADVKSLFRR